MSPSVIAVLIFLGFVFLAFVAHRVIRLLLPNPRHDRLLIAPTVVTALVAVGVLAALYEVLPDDDQGHFVTLVGLLITALIALFSASFLSNLMAGLLIQRLKSFGQGDWIKVGEYLGQVTRVQILSTTIEDEHNDKISIPNSYISARPVKVFAKGETLVSCTVSLGYDVPRMKVTRALKRAARFADLDEPVVRILELGDYSVSYKVAARLKTPARMRAAWSRLREQVLDRLHEEGIEIVSPDFRNIRRLEAQAEILPEPRSAPIARDSADGEGPDGKLAAQVERIRTALPELQEYLAKSEQGVAEAKSNQQIERWERYALFHKQLIEMIQKVAEAHARNKDQFDRETGDALAELGEELDAIGMDHDPVMEWQTQLAGKCRWCVDDMSERWAGEGAAEDSA